MAVALVVVVTLATTLWFLGFQSAPDEIHYFRDPAKHRFLLRPQAFSAIQDLSRQGLDVQQKMRKLWDEIPSEGGFCSGAFCPNFAVRPETPRSPADQAKVAELRSRIQTLGEQHQQLVRTATSIYQTEVIDSIKESLPYGSIVFNAPTYAPLNEQTFVVFIVNKAAELQQLKQSVANSLKDLEQPLAPSRFPELIAERIKISNVMTVALAGPGFEIAALNPETKAVPSDGNIEWTWAVKPHVPGKHVVNLTVSALIQPVSQQTPLEIATYRREIVVTTSWWEALLEFVKANKEVFGGATAILVFAGTVWGFLRRIKPRKAT